jgi:hypothetical protein
VKAASSAQVRTSPFQRAITEIKLSNINFTFTSVNLVYTVLNHPHFVMITNTDKFARILTMVPGVQD